MAKTTTKKKSPKTVPKKQHKPLSLKMRLMDFRDRCVLRLQKLLRIIIYSLIFIALLPFLLTILYRFEFVTPISMPMLARIVTFQPMKRDWVEFDDIAPTLYQSVLMSEDGKFCSHSGVDWGALNTVISDALDGERSRGASTITMQTAKNLFLWSGRSYLRKALEIPLATWLDLILSKKRIMEIYLNIAEWDGNGVYGIQAGAKSQFGTTAAKLSRRQSALMAVTLPNPILREPSKPTKKLAQLARKIERRAKQSGAYIKCLK